MHLKSNLVETCPSTAEGPFESSWRRQNKTSLALPIYLCLSIHPATRLHNFLLSVDRSIDQSVYIFSVYVSIDLFTLAVCIQIFFTTSFNPSTYLSIFLSVSLFVCQPVSREPIFVGPFLFVPFVFVRPEGGKEGRNERRKEGRKANFDKIHTTVLTLVYARLLAKHGLAQNLVPGVKVYLQLWTNSFGRCVQ